MPDTIIIQRVVPHYRAPLFEALHERFGWVTVTSSNPPCNYAKMEEPPANGYLSAIPFDWKGIRRCNVPLRTIIETHRPRRVISDFGMRMNVGWGLWRARARQKIESYALWSHGWNMERGFDGLFDRAAQYARLPAFAAADMLLTYTQEGARWVEQCLPGKRVIALGNTIDVDGIADIAGTASPVRFGDPQLLAVGRLTEDKAYECLIETFLKVKEQLPNAALTVIGDGPQRSLLEQQAGADLGSAIRILGALYDERQLAPHFIGADFFVIAGAAGLSVNHALAYGLPVICYGRGQGLPNHHPEIEYVVDGITGFICLDAGADSFARLIIDAYREGASRLLRPSVKEFVRDRLRLARVVDRFGVVDRYL